MRAIELLEARRNPEQNPRVETGHKGAVNHLSEYDVLDNIGITMTAIDKVGVNPRSTYNTPNGVYFYPARYYMNLKDRNKPKQLPFQDDAEFIQIIRFPEPVLFLDTYTEANYRRDIEKLTEALDKIPGLVDKVKRKFTYSIALGNWSDDPDQQSFKPYFDNLDNRKKEEAKVAIPGGHIWYVTWQLSQDLRDVIGTKSANIWNWLLRSVLGYNTVIDYDQKIIYPQEPTQGVVLNTSAIDRIKSISNQEPIADLRSNLKNMVWSDIVKLYAKKRISIHDVRKLILANVQDSPVLPTAKILPLLWYLEDIDPNWKYGRNLLVQQLQNDKFSFENVVMEFMTYFTKHPQRWPELEPVMAQSAPLRLLLWYAENILKVRWPAIEPKVISYLNTAIEPGRPVYASALDYAIRHKIRLPDDAEIYLALMAKRYGVMSHGERGDIAYARNVLRDTDPEKWYRRTISDYGNRAENT